MSLAERPLGPKGHVASSAIAQADPLEIKTWLEWAGQRLLSLRERSPAPQSYRSFWPDYADEAAKAYGYNANRLRAALPTGKEITLMEEVLDLVVLIPDITTRRIVHSRALVAPVSGRYLLSWTKLAFALHSSPRRIVLLHRKGLREIALRVPVGKADAIRQSLGSALA